MAIKLNIVTAFDDRELKRAQREIASVGRSLSRGLDVAVLGGIAALGAGLASSVQSLARIETINTQTEAVIKSMGNAAGLTASQIEAMAGKLETLTSTEAETIQQGANLLLTFGNIKDAAGEGNDIFTQTVTAMVDMGRAMGTDASSSAIQLGKALNDPTKGITALTRVGVSFTDQQKEQIKTLQKNGDMMGAQKIILSELQNQFGGSGAAYAKTFSGQLDQMRNELGNMGEEIAKTVMPAIQDMIGAIREAIPEIGPKLKRAVESVDWKKFVDFLVAIISNIDKIAAAVVGLWAVTKAFALMKTAIELVSVAMGILNGTIALSPIGLLIGALALGVTGFIALSNAADDAGRSIAEANRQKGFFSESKGITTELFGGKPKAVSDETKKLVFRNNQEIIAANLPGNGNGGGAKTKAVDYVKEWSTAMADELAKQNARMVLKNKGLSDALIESVVGSGTGWKKVFENINSLAATPLARLQQSFNKTAAGIAEIAKATEENNAKIKAANEQLIADLTKTLETAQGKLDAITAELNPAAKSVLEVYQDAKRAYEELTASSAAFAKTIPDVVSGIRNMTQLAEPIGQFEQQVVSSFANVEASLKSALDSKLITDQSYADLSAWAKREMSLMQDIARQRDELAKKISLAEAVYNDSKNAILAYGNINGLLKTTSQTITETQTKIVDGITISLTKSVEQVSQNNLVDQYKAILQKTKDFANNLNALKKMGLNKDLFKQIVDAGVETGGATAAAIIQGGQQGVTELNNVFTDLQAVGDQVGETTAVVMFNNGVDVMGGFINGMKAQEASLAATAKTLAETFASAFGTALKTALQIAIDAAKEQMKTAMAALLAEKAALEAEIAGLKTQIGNVGKPGPVVVDNAGDYIPVGAMGAGALGYRGGASVVDGGSKNFYVTVTNPDPNAVVDALKKYTKQNGNILI